MTLYPKRLRSIDDLEKEKKHLIQKSKKLEQEEFLSVEGLLGKNTSGGKKDKQSKVGGNSTIESIIDMLPISNPLVSMAIKMIQRRLFKREETPRTAYAPPPNGKKKQNKLRFIAIEFIGGYLKWKAIELSYKGIKHLINRKKESGQ